MRKLLLLCSILFLVGCLPQSTVTLLTREQADVAPTGEKIAPFDTTYGAHYLVDELYMQVDFSSLGASTKMIYNKILRIDDQRGLEYATFSLPNSSSSSAFSFRMWDSTGMEVPLDHARMTQDFYDNGKVAFPAVTPGCDLQVLVEYSEDDTYHSYEHWFNSFLPIKRGRFTFEIADEVSYKSKLYGPENVITARNEMVKSKRNRSGNTLKKVWEVGNVFPLSQTEYESSPDLAIPRVSIALHSEAFSDTVLFFTNWKSIADEFKRDVLNSEKDTGNKVLIETVNKISDGLLTSKERAESLFSWVRDSVYLVDGGIQLVDVEAVLNRKQGTLWDKAVLLHYMFRVSGFESDVMVTRAKRHGGFDGDFITPAQLSVPLVIIKVDEQKSVAFPYNIGAALGEYPSEYFSLKALSIETGKIEILPEPEERTSLIEQEILIDLTDENEVYQGHIIVSGYKAFAWRKFLIPLSDLEKKEAIQKILSSYDSDNVLIDGAFYDLEKIGESIKIEFSFKNSTNKVLRKGKKYMQLSPLFENLLTAVSVDRKHPLYIEHGYTQKERVILKNSGSVTMANEVHSESVESPLFSLKTAIAQEAGDLAIERTTTIKACNIQPAELKAMEPKFKRLNSLKSESVIY